MKHLYFLYFLFVRNRIFSIYNLFFYSLKSVQVFQHMGIWSHLLAISYYYNLSGKNKQTKTAEDKGRINPT